MPFKNNHTFSKRINESGRILIRYPDRIPIICEKAKSCNIEINKNKYLVPMNLTIGQFIYVIRKRMYLGPEQAIYLFINGIIPPINVIISNLYDIYKDNDGFLYITYNDENVFG